MNLCCLFVVYRVNTEADGVHEYIYKHRRPVQGVSKCLLLPNNSLVALLTAYLFTAWLSAKAKNDEN